MVGRVGRFNGDEVPKILRVYNAEMTKWGTDEAMRLEYFCQLVAVSMYEELKELQEPHESLESFEGALLGAYRYAKLEHRGRHDFDRWVASVKAHRNAMESFQEFERRFAQLSE
mgnify:CR=1 FL=1